MGWLNIRKAERNPSSFTLLTDDYSKKSVPNLALVRMTECSFDLMTLRNTKWYKQGNFISWGQNHHKLGSLTWGGCKMGPYINHSCCQFSPRSLRFTINTVKCSSAGPGSPVWGTYTSGCFLTLFIKDSTNLPLAEYCVILLTNSTCCS